MKIKYINSSSAEITSGLKMFIAECGISAYYFYHIFNAFTSRSPIAYLSEYRIKKAEILVHSTDIGMNGNSSSVGFWGICYFSGCFKRLHGGSPMKSRDIYRNSGEAVKLGTK